LTPLNLQKPKGKVKENNNLFISSNNNLALSDNFSFSHSKLASSPFFSFIFSFFNSSRFNMIDGYTNFSFFNQYDYSSSSFIFNSLIKSESFLFHLLSGKFQLISHQNENSDLSDFGCSDGLNDDITLEKFNNLILFFKNSKNSSTLPLFSDHILKNQNSPLINDLQISEKENRIQISSNNSNEKGLNKLNNILQLPYSHKSLFSLFSSVFVLEKLRFSSKKLIENPFHLKIHTFNYNRSVNVENLDVYDDFYRNSERNEEIIDGGGKNVMEIDEYSDSYPVLFDKESEFSDFEDEDRSDVDSCESVENLSSFDMYENELDEGVNEDLSSLDAVRLKLCGLNIIESVLRISHTFLSSSKSSTISSLSSISYLSATSIINNNVVIIPSIPEEGLFILVIIFFLNFNLKRLL
jgi:hypothetical protein